MYFIRPRHILRHRTIYFLKKSFSLYFFLQFLYFHLSHVRFWFSLFLVPSFSCILNKGSVISWNCRGGRKGCSRRLTDELGALVEVDRWDYVIWALETMFSAVRFGKWYETDYWNRFEGTTRWPLIGECQTCSFGWQNLILGLSLQGRIRYPDW